MITKTANNQINYDKNLRKLLGWERTDLKVLREAQGVLKGKLKISAVAYQRKIRREWENRMSKLEKMWKK